MKPEAYEKVLENLKRVRIPKNVKEIVKTLLDKKAENIVVLKLKGIVDFTDYLVICHGNSTKQNQAMSDEVIKRMRNEFKQKPFSKEGEQLGEWILIDYIDFILHIFLEQTRDKYNLEKLWLDAKRYDFSIN